jgi:hypothetical protein
MSQVKRAQFQVYPLRGMDTRFKPRVQGHLNTSAATLVRDMTWSENDSWMDAGGYRVVRENGVAGQSGTAMTDNDPADVGDPRSGSNPGGGTGGQNG